MKKIFTLFFAALTVVLFQKAIAQNTSPYWSLAGNNNASTSSKLGTTNSIPLNLTTSNQTRVYISTAGNVGIGTTSPQAKLHIVDQVNTGGGYYKPLRLYNPALATGEHVQLAIGRANSTYNQGEINFNLVGGVGSANNTLSFGLYSNPTILTLQGTGNVGIGTATPAYKLHVEGPNVAIYGNSADGTGVYGAGDESGVAGTGNLWAVYGNSDDGVGVQGDSYSFTGVGGFSTGGSGTAGESNSGDGVFGISQSGYGVHGSSEESNGGYFHSIRGYSLVAQTDSAFYAGVFYGNVFTTGNYYPSDKNLKDNIQEFSGALNIIGKLKPRYYTYKQDKKLAFLRLPTGNHYGLMAQDVEQVLPNLVSTDNQQAPVGMKQSPILKHSPNAQKPTPQQTVEKGETINLKAVNYTELIPILVKGMQEQQALIEKQNERLAQQDQKIETLTALVNKLSGNQSTITTADNAALLQATPNPSSTTTRISYHLPQGISRAQLLLTDAQGKMLRAISLNNSGTVDVNTASLSSGMYNYSLYVEGKVIDTKKLVVTR